MNEFKNWKEVTRGLYRYVIAPGACYEIHIIHWEHKTDILSANSMLYIVGEWGNNVVSFFERKLLLKGPMAACLQKAVEDYEENVEEK